MKPVEHVVARAATAADITPEWIAMLAAILRRDGQAFRAGAHAATIEIQVINTGAWMPLNLPTNGALFESKSLRDDTFIVLVKAVADTARPPWCNTMDRPAAKCRCPDCGPCLVDFKG